MVRPTPFLGPVTLWLLPRGFLACHALAAMYRPSTPVLLDYFAYSGQLVATKKCTPSDAKVTTLLDWVNALGDALTIPETDRVFTTLFLVGIGPLLATDVFEQATTEDVSRALDRDAEEIETIGLSAIWKICRDGTVPLPQVPQCLAWAARTSYFRDTLDSIGNDLGGRVPKLVGGSWIETAVNVRRLLRVAAEHDLSPSDPSYDRFMSALDGFDRTWSNHRAKIYVDDLREIATDVIMSLAARDTMALNLLNISASVLSELSGG